MEKARTNPKTWLVEKIYNNKKEIGQLMLVSYLTNSKPHLEFFLKEEFWNKGIMSKELSKYLKQCKKWHHFQLIANVKQDNIASIKLLENNGFVKMMDIRDTFVYLIDLNFTKDKLAKVINKTLEAFPVENR